MKTLPGPLSWLGLLLPIVAAQVANVTLTLTPTTTDFDTDNTAFIYSRSPLLIGNDGSAADGGLRVFGVANSTRFEQKAQRKTGRSKVVVPVYDVGGRDVVVNIPAPDSVFRVFDAWSLEEVESGERKKLGDWSTACVWRSRGSGENYMFLFGKRMVVQFLVREQRGNVEILEVSVCSKSHYRN